MSDATFDSTKVSLQDLLKNIRSGKIQLPDFQRGWVWDDDRIRSLIASLSVSFPIGALMLLETGGQGIRFKPRPVQGIKEVEHPEPELLILDGQQRLTSLYQALMLDCPVRTEDTKGKAIARWYYFDMKQMVNGNTDREDAILSIPDDRLVKTFGRRIELDLTTAEKEFQQNLFPVNQVFNSAGWRRAYQKYWEYDAEKIQLFDDFEVEIIKRFEQYQIPVIELKKETPKEAVCLVFEKVNTGGVSLTVFELLTATFAADNFQLREDWAAREKRLKTKHKVLRSLKSDDFLQAISLLVTQERRREALANDPATDKAPGIGCKRRDILRLTVDDYKKWADAVEQGFVSAARFLHSQKIFRARDLPYRTQLVPLATIFVDLGKEGETEGARHKIARWYWCGVLGELYGSATESRFARDVPEVVEYVRNTELEPTTIRDANFVPSRLLTLRTRNSAAYKGIYALLMRSGCLDFRTGEPIETQTFFDEALDIHHIFPRKWCKTHEIERNIYNSIINKTAIAARTNRKIGGKAPSEYLRKLETDAGIDLERMSVILASHGIDPDLLYSDRFWQFFETRGEALLQRIEQAMGKPIGREPGVFRADAPQEEYDDGVIDWEADADDPDEDGEEPEDVENRAELEQRFHAAMINLYQTAKREIDYTPTYFLQMVSEYGGLKTAKRLIHKDKPSEGFTTLYLKNSLELSVEAHVIRPEFAPLFTTEEIAIARARLKKYRFEFDDE
jgi:hypothetical protein